MAPPGRALRRSSSATGSQQAAGKSSTTTVVRQLQSSPGRTSNQSQTSRPIVEMNVPTTVHADMNGFKGTMTPFSLDQGNTKQMHNNLTPVTEQDNSIVKSVSKYVSNFKKFL